MFETALLVDAWEIHPKDGAPVDEIASVMVALAVLSGVPVTWVARQAVATPATSVDDLTRAIEATEV